VVGATSEVVDADGRLWRNPAATVLLEDDALRVIVPPDVLVTWRGEDAEVARRLLVAASVAGVAAPAGDTREEAISAALLEHGALEARTAGGTAEPGGTPLRVVYGITGAVAAVRSHAYLDALRRGGAELRIVMTQPATRFVAADGLRWAFGVEVSTDLFTPSGVEHVQLGVWADVIAVVPASAEFLCRLAAGGYSDLLAATIAAADAPVVLVPSMNPRMWERLAVQRALRDLEEEGFTVVLPAAGREVGEGGVRAFGGAGVTPAALTTVLGQAVRRRLADAHDGASASGDKEAHRDSAGGGASEQ
jgi:3-polyprenyl-4-hydroxybenzoate decarboxylase